VKTKKSSPLLKLFIAVFLCLLTATNSFADRTIDSLKKVLKTQQADTARVKTLHTLIIDLITLGNYPQADSLIQEELTISGKHGYKQGIANAVLAKGIVDYYQGLYSAALVCLYDSRKKFDTIGDQHGIASSILYMGYVYEGQLETKKALDKFNEASLLFAALKDDDYNATAIIHIGNIYNNLVIDYDKARANYIKALELFTKAKDDDGIASVYEDMGVMYYHQKQYDTALFYQKKALELFEKLNDREGLSKSVVYLGNVYYDLKNYTQAIECADRSLSLAKEIGSYSDIRDAEYLSSEAYLGMENPMQALTHYKNFVAAKDTILSQENTKKGLEAEISFEFAKKQAVIQAEQDRKDAERKLEERKQQIILYFISGILILILGFAIFAYRSYLQKQRDNKELDVRNKKIEAAYSIIEEKNREITDSINYARRIQHAILPERQTIEKSFPQSFVLFKPKDIVSGDFYWMHKSDGHTLIAAADCTGHGVPGGFMSMIGSEKLNDAALQNSDTGKILSLLNKGIKKSLHQSEEQDTTRDGMDIALCKAAPLNPPDRGTLLEFSGANRPLWIIRKGSNEVEEIKADKRAIGGFTEGEQNFQTHSIQLQKGDSFYIFSDGYADQFGGPQGKKLSTKKFREMLLSIQNLSMQEQLKFLDKSLEDWKLDREQLDDVLVIGIRV